MERLAIVTVESPNLMPWCAATAASKEELAHRWGLGFYRLDAAAHADHRPPSWAKITASRRVLPSFDWVWCMDADTCVTNMTLDPKELLDDSQDMLVSADKNGINCGSVFWRNCPKIVEFLYRVWNRTEFVNHNWWEQAAIRAEIEENPINSKMIDKRRINGYPDDWQHGDGVLHCPGDFSYYRPHLIDHYAQAIR